MKKLIIPLITFLLLLISVGARNSPRFPHFWVEKQLRLSDDLTLQYVEQGSSTGLPVVFLHGYSDSWHSYERVLPLLPHSVHAYALSMRGHGNSSRPATGYHPDDLADDVAGFLKKLHPEGAVIVGHSLGGTVAQSLATRYPELTRGLVLVSTFSHYNKPVMNEFNRAVMALKDPVDEGFVREFQRSTLTRPVPDAFFATVVEESKKLPAHVWKGIMKGMLRTDYTEKLKAVRVPTLILWGRKDTFATNDDQVRLLSVIKGSEMVSYDGIGHALHWEDPALFSRELLRFLHIPE